MKYHFPCAFVLDYKLPEDMGVPGLPSTEPAGENTLKTHVLNCMVTVYPQQRCQTC